jgi:hypothetical protein
LNFTTIHQEAPPAWAEKHFGEVDLGDPRRNQLIEGIERELKSLAEQNPHVTRLMTHPGIGTLTGLALVHTLGPVGRFATARKVTA